MSQPIGGRVVRTARAADALAVGEPTTLRTRAGLSVPKVATGVPGFDAVCMGGLPVNRVAVVAGQAGSGKTVFAAHLLAEGVRRGEAGILVTLEEPATDLRANLQTLGWDVAAWEAEGEFAIVDASPLVRDGGDVEEYSLDTMAAQIGHAVDRTGATRLVIDSLNTVLSFGESPALARQRLRRLVGELRRMGLTIVVTVETPDDPGLTLSRYGIEEFVADSVILLRHVHEGRVRRRSLEVLKMRGAMHRKGEHAFTVLPGEGVVVLPQAVIQDGQLRPPVRVPTGNSGLDAMTGGGWWGGSVILMDGPGGSGKTLLSTEFLAGGAAAGERVMMLAFEESPAQIVRHALARGLDLETYQQAGLLNIVALYPEVASLDDHLVEVMDLVDRLRPSRLVVDSLSSLERIGQPGAFRDFLVSLTSYVRQEGITTVLTQSAVTQEPLVLPGQVSTLSDAVVLLRYAGSQTEVQRRLTLIKMRGSAHDLRVRRVEIRDAGMTILPIP